MVKVSVLLLLAALPAVPQFGNANRLQSQPIKPGMTCASDAYVLTWVTARNQFECLAASGGASPGGSPSQGQYQVDATTFGGTSDIYEYPANIADPSPLIVVPTCSGTCATDYSYAVVIFNGIGWTLASTDTTVSNAVTLDGSHFNAITLPTLTDPNLSCVVIRTAGTTDKKYITSLSNGSVCDGRTVNDAFPGGTDATISLPGANTTQGVLVGQVSGFSQSPGSGGGPQTVTIGGVQTSNGIDYTFLNCCSDWKFVDQLGNQTMSWLPALDNSGISFSGLGGTRLFRFVNVQLLLGNLSTSAPVISDSSRILRSGTYHGNTTAFQTSDGTGTADHAAIFDASGNVTDGPAGITQTCATPVTAVTVIKGVITAITCP